MRKIETRILNEMRRDFEKKEELIYARHSMASQLIYNANEPELFDLVEHPEWQQLTQEL